MAISQVITNGMAGLTGVYHGQRSPVFIGPALQAKQSGPLYTGYTIESGTVVLHAFFDPDQSLRMQGLQREYPEFAASTYHIGFIQTGELTINNIVYPLSAYEFHPEVPIFNPLDDQFINPFSAKRRRNEFVETPPWVDMPETGINGRNIYHPVFGLWAKTTNARITPSQLHSYPQQFGGVVKHCAEDDLSCAAIPSAYQAASLHKELSLPLNKLSSSYDPARYFDNLDLLDRPIVVMPTLQPDDLSNINLVLETFFNTPGVAPVASSKEGQNFFLPSSNRLMYTYSCEFLSTGRNQGRSLTTRMVLFFETDQQEVAFTYLDQDMYSNYMGEVLRSGPVNVGESNEGLFHETKRSRMNVDDEYDQSLVIDYRFTTVPCAFIPDFNGRYTLFPFEYFTWKASRIFYQNQAASEIMISQADPFPDSDMQLRQFIDTVTATMLRQSNNQLQAVWLY